MEECKVYSAIYGEVTMFSRALIPIAMALAAGCGAVEQNGKGKDAPSPMKEGLSWTVDDLLAHLKKNGMAFTVASKHPGGAGLDPSAALRLEDKGDETDVWIVDKGSLREAEGHASLINLREGQHGHAWAWGRFVVGTLNHREFIDAAKKALSHSGAQP